MVGEDPETVSVSHVHDTLKKLVERALPGATVTGIQELKPDTSDDESTLKGIGYGAPQRISVVRAGRAVDLVFHSATSNPFGHDRRSDRAAEMLLAFDTFALIPGHVPAIDVGAVTASGDLVSLKDTGEFYLVTEYAQGHVYADDLRRVAEQGEALPTDIERARELALYLTRLHALPADPDGEQRYQRSVRDLVGSGEGIFGIIDGYPADTSRKTWKRLRRIEKKCDAWRWRLRPCHARLRRIHGDFHPFNLVFADTSREQGQPPPEPPKLSLLDTSRGSAGDPADDVTCLAINYVFFALQDPSAWKRGFSKLWKTFWKTYLAETGDQRLTRVAPPYFMWRALVLSNPTWYPSVKPRVRERLLDLAEQALEARAFDPKSAEHLFD